MAQRVRDPVHGLILVGPRSDMTEPVDIADISSVVETLRMNCGRF